VSPVRLLYTHDAFVAVDKPAGVTVIPGRSQEGGPSLREQLEAQLGRTVWVVHRLDRDTSGVLLFALNPRAHRTLSMAFEAGRVEKRYLALARGSLSEAQDVRVPLVPARRGRMRPARNGESEAKEAHTHVRPLEHFGERATLVEATPLTGRTHQIRVHLLAIGHPLLFDHQYGQTRPATAQELGGAGDEVVLARTPLHAARLRLHGLEGLPEVEVVSPPPEDLAKALELLRSGGTTTA
jgi:tRNA pseudouridine32 synthase / 23S rRNA pseudouridine746 synthase